MTARMSPCDVHALIDGSVRFRLLRLRGDVDVANVLDAAIRSAATGERVLAGRHSIVWQTTGQRETAGYVVRLANGEPARAVRKWIVELRHGRDLRRSVKLDEGKSVLSPRDGRPVDFDLSLGFVEGEWTTQPWLRSVDLVSRWALAPVLFTLSNRG